MEYTKAKKYFFTITGVWYFSFVSMFYPLILSFFESPQSVYAGRILAAVDALIMLIVFILYGIILFHALKNKDYKIAVLTTGLVILPIFWALATIDDTFGTSTISRYI